jgi:hypothetical protein
MVRICFFKTYCLGYLVTCPVTGYFGNGNCPADALVDDLDGKLLAMMRLMFHQPVEWTYPLDPIGLVGKNM